MLSFDFPQFDFSGKSVQCISIVKRKANSTIKQQKRKDYEKRDRLLISKMEINYQISQLNKNLRIDPVFTLAKGV